MATFFTFVARYSTAKTAFFREAVAILTRGAKPADTSLFSLSKHNKFIVNDSPSFLARRRGDQ